MVYFHSVKALFCANLSAAKALLYQSDFLIEAANKRIRGSQWVRNCFSCCINGIVPEVDQRLLIGLLEKSIIPTNTAMKSNVLQWLTEWKSSLELVGWSLTAPQAVEVAMTASRIWRVLMLLLWWLWPRRQWVL